MDAARVRLQDAGIRVLAGCPASGLKTTGRGDGCRHAIFDRDVAQIMRIGGSAAGIKAGSLADGSIPVVCCQKTRITYYNDVIKLEQDT